MNNGLELAMWMITTVVVGFWLWASGSLKRLRDLPFDRLLLGLLVVAVLCRGTGATFLLTVGIALWFALKWTKLRLPALVLLTFGPLYFITRSTGLWSGRETSDLVRMVVNQTRADSLLFRLVNEDMLAAKALQRPLFGWGGWGRNRVFDEEGRDLYDHRWVLDHYPRKPRRGRPDLLDCVAAATDGHHGQAVPGPSLARPVTRPVCRYFNIVNLHLIDCIANAFPNSIYILSLGAVTEVLTRLGPPARRAPAPTMALAVSNPLKSSAIRHDRLARSLKQQGRPREAEAAWLSAQRAWSRLAAEFPDVPEYRRHWLDGYNDLAWLLLTTPDRGQRDVSRAILLAEKAVERAPECGTYWNTLGIAYFRAGDWKAAIAALERSIASDGGGTSFDFFFLGMAYWHQGDERRPISGAPAPTNGWKKIARITRTCSASVPRRHHFSPETSRVAESASWVIEPLPHIVQLNNSNYKERDAVGGSPLTLTTGSDLPLGIKRSETTLEAIEKSDAASRPGPRTQSLDSGAVSLGGCCKLITGSIP